MKHLPQIVRDTSALRPHEIRRLRSIKLPHVATPKQAHDLAAEVAAARLGYGPHTKRPRKTGGAS